MLLKIYRHLRKLGILSINQRNSDYVLLYNDRKRYPLVDDKLQTKKLAEAAGISVPPLFMVVEAEHQIKGIHKALESYRDFVIKPARGAGGDGIIVVTDRVFNRYRLVNGKLMSEDEINYHLSCLLSGTFSLGGYSDHALIEKRVIVDPVFADVSYEGIPDIRIITLLGYPAMAMVRLPTRNSGGKANLHQGAIGAGISLKTGKTLSGVFHHDIIDYHPDTLNSIIDIDVPDWSEILELAAKCYELTGLGYLGVDIVLDKTHGPMMLELNARPGLNIQIANKSGVLHRYQTIEAHADALKATESIAERVAFSREVFP